MVCIDAQVGGDGHGCLDNLARVLLPGHNKSPGRRGGIATSRTDADYRVVRINHIAGAGQEIAVFDIHERQHGVEFAQIFVGAPLLGQLYGRALQVVVVLLQFGLKFFKQRQGVGHGPGKATQDFSLCE